MSSEEVKRGRSLTSALITALIIFMLIFSGPAGAVSITIPTIPSSITQGQDLTLTFQVTLNTGERIPVNSYNITVYNSTWQQTFLVYPGGAVGPNVTLNPAGSSYNVFSYGYGYQWGYGYGYNLNYYNYTFGYGYGYGYAAPGYETYNVTLELSAFNLAAGSYNVNITIDTGDASKIYSSTAYSFTIAGVYESEVITPTATTTIVKQNITSMEQGQTVSSGVITTTQGNFEFTVTASAATPPVEITTNVSTETPTGVSDVATYEGAIPGLYFTIDVNDTAWYNNISQVQVKLYYDEADIPADVDESTLRPLRYTAGSWVRLVAPPQTTLADGTILYASGVDTASNYVWANLSRFSVYGIGGTVEEAAPVAVAAPAVGVAVGAVMAGLGEGFINIAVTKATIAELVNKLNFFYNDFYVAPPELAGVLASLDYMPTAAEYAEDVEDVIYASLDYLPTTTEQAEGLRLIIGRLAPVVNTYEKASELALKKYTRSSKVIIARGDIGVDSMAATMYARTMNVPILLVDPGELPEVTEAALEKLGTKQVIIVGGPVAVSRSVEALLPSPERIWGQDRFETAVKLAEALMEKREVDTLVITDGWSPDVHAVMVASRYKAPILYVSGDELPEVTKKFLEKHKLNKIRRVITIGVSEKAAEAVEEVMK
jgi:hypothetical protein